MSRRRRNDDWDRIEAGVKLVLFGGVGLALAVGGIGGFAKTFQALVSLVVFGLLAALAVGLLFILGRWWLRRVPAPPPPTAAPSGRPPNQAAAADRDPVEHQPAWTIATIRSALDEIDWYQFEKYCSALLRSEGYAVERKGGAQPDGGVNLVATRDGNSVLVQCKHWRTWTLQEKVVREMLGSMAHFQVSQGAIYTLKGWTKPAAGFAIQHQITLVDAAELARRGLGRLSSEELDTFLKPREHHCPKCEAKMVLRTGNFTSFWGCSIYPRCRGKLNYEGAR